MTRECARGEIGGVRGVRDGKRGIVGSSDNDARRAASISPLEVIAVAELHLLLVKVQPPLVHLQLRLPRPVLVLDELQGDLGVGLGAGDLVLVLEEEMLHALLVDLNDDLVLLLEVLRAAELRG